MLLNVATTIKSFMSLSCIKSLENWNISFSIIDSHSIEIIQQGIKSFN